MDKNNKLKVNKFYFYAQRYAENVTADAEIKQIDMTKEFWDEIEQEIINDELVNININAKVRMSKSTTGIAIGQKVFELLLRHSKREEDDFGMKNIARDEQEYSKRMRDPETAFTVIVTDEINELEGTGENVTVERALNKVFSNVQAGRYVHRISCSPKDVADPNADIFLEVIGVDRINKITHTHLYYRMFKAGEEYLQLLGHVNFDVGKLIKIWDSKVKKIFLKPKRTEKDEKLINYWKKRDFYTEYMVKKYEKMELITKEGIMRPRMLDYAEIILHIVNELRQLTKLNILNKNTIKNYVRMTCRSRKIPVSIVGEELMTQEVDGVLNLWKNYFKLMKDLNKLEDRFLDKKIDQQEYEIKKEMIKGMADKLMDSINAQTNELERCKAVNERYNTIESGKKK